MANYLATDTDLTAVANAIRAKGGTSAQLAFPAGFVSAIDAIPTGGGGGMTKIADGTITGAGQYEIDISLGKKMAQSDFVFNLWVDNGTEFTYAATYQIVNLQFILQKKFGAFDLSTDGAKLSSDSISVDSNNGGTITTKTMRANVAQFMSMRNGALSDAIFNPVGSSSWKITRSSSGFVLRLYGNNTSFILATGKTYKWEVLYFGSAPSTDIVEVP